MHERSGSRKPEPTELAQTRNAHSRRHTTTCRVCSGIANTDAVARLYSAPIYPPPIQSRLKLNPVSIGDHVSDCWVLFRLFHPAPKRSQPCLTSCSIHGSNRPHVIYSVFAANTATARRKHVCIAAVQEVTRRSGRSRRESSRFLRQTVMDRDALHSRGCKGAACLV